MPLDTEAQPTEPARRAVAVLERAVSRGRLAHALLLQGENLKALETVAARTARNLLALTAGRDPLQHPDCFTLRPSGKARFIRVADKDGHPGPNTMRGFIREIQFSPNQAERKVGLVFEADRMNPATQNAFLKTLEEPPADTTLLLITTRPFDLLDTIRSRCLNVRLPADLQAIDAEAWRGWQDAYRQWVHFACRGPSNREAVVRGILGAYGLIARFQDFLNAFTEEAWQARKANLPENLSTEETDAIEAGLRRGLRIQLLSELETATRDAALADPDAPADPSKIRKLARVVAELEHARGLLDLNMQEGTALECFFLKAVRIWAGRE
ncbi:MAG: DNA polymerase III subunit gamma/tau [Opitutales bacterium]